MAAQPQNGLSQAVKAEKKKAKKARQRAAQTQAAAQTAGLRAEPAGCKEPALAESMGSASKREHPADRDAATELPVAEKSVAEVVSAAAPDSPPSPKTPVPLSEVTASSRASPLSPQPSPQLHSGSSPEQLIANLPSCAAADAQAQDPAVQDGESWEEVRHSRRKPLSQQAISEASTRKARKPSQGAPNQHAVSAAHPREIQGIAQEAGLTLSKAGTLAEPPHAQSGHVAAEQLPQWLSVLSVSQPQQPSKHEESDFAQPFQPHALPTSMQHGSFHASPNSIAPNVSPTAAEPMPQPGLRFGSFSPEQVRMLAARIGCQQAPVEPASHVTLSLTYGWDG